MKSGVYVTSGLGNIEYLSSASHGAGRKMSRKKAKKNIDMEGFRKSMKGIVAKVTVGTLDESPQAYKNIDKIINAQRGVVIDVVDYIKPLINIKG
jgi:tRNA-splicing ligase RtcB